MFKRLDLDRRTLLASAGAALTTSTIARRARAQSNDVTITMRSDRLGANVWFDPIGVRVDPGTTIRWHLHENVHTATAYHPANGARSLRVPHGAEPWDSGYLVEPGTAFSVTLVAEGVYDYFCLPHEAAGMVGRIIVGAPGGPGARPFDYFERWDPAPGWLPVPEAAQRAFPSVQSIMDHRAVSID